ncbi:MAG: hypothetical protein M3T96_02605 [Acidobacteriota bacterium]|nr:hypothetical protein [Acidobacteriota bacterium]
MKIKKTTILTIAALSAALGLTAACSSGANTAATNTTTAANVNKTTMNANTAVVINSGETKSADDTPASVKAAFPDAQSFTKQHKDIPKDVLADIEKDTGAKVPDTDHHSYLAFSTNGGARKQIGAATVVTAGGKEMVVVYDSKNGSPVIKEIRAEGIPAAFLAQFAGKGHDDKFQIGADLKANGVEDAAAKAIAQAVHIDAVTMQNLYGAAHTH